MKNIIFFIIPFAIIWFLGICLNVSMDSAWLVPCCMAAVVAGTIYEGCKINKDRLSEIGLSVAVFVLSLGAFLPSRRAHHYDFISRLNAWPYFFSVLYLIIRAITLQINAIPKLTEGATMVFSVALVYWWIDHRFYEISLWLNLVFAFFPLYSLLHAFTYIPLVRDSRVALSIWSAAVMLVFALDNLYQVFWVGSDATASSAIFGQNIAMQRFWAGASLVWAADSILLLFPFRDWFMESNYFDRIKDSEDLHAKKYSDRQLPIAHALIGLGLLTAFFCANHAYHILPGNLAIWLVLSLVPFVFAKKFCGYGQA